MEKTDKSAEEILDKIESDGCYYYSQVIKAMETYAAQQLSEYKTTIELLIPLAERGMLKELNHTHQYIINRAKKLIEK